MIAGQLSSWMIRARHNAKLYTSISSRSCSFQLERCGFCQQIRVLDCAKSINDVQGVTKPHRKIYCSWD